MRQTPQEDASAGFSRSPPGDLGHWSAIAVRQPSGRRSCFESTPNAYMINFFGPCRRWPEFTQGGLGHLRSVRTRSGRSTNLTDQSLEEPTEYAGEARGPDLLSASPGHLRAGGRESVGFDPGS